jgi:HEAT repeat protein
VPFLVHTFETRTWRVRSGAAQALNFVALALAESGYLLGRLPGTPGADTGDLVGLVDVPTARRFLGDRLRRYQVGAFAGWVLAAARDPQAVPLFEDVLATERRDAYLRLVAAYGLVRAGRLEYVCELVGFLGEPKHEYQDAVPSLLLEIAPEHPDELGLCLARGLEDPRARGREVSAWTAGAGHVVGAAPALRDALADPMPRVRAAAAWALGRLRDAPARSALARATSDPDERVRAFAAEALDCVDGAAP